MSEHKFTTLGLHIGDRPNDPYQPGETRVVDDPTSVQHLVDGGTLGKFDAQAEEAFLEARKKTGDAESPVEATPKAPEEAAAAVVEDAPAPAENKAEAPATPHRRKAAH